MYIAPGQGQKTAWRQTFDVNRKALSLCPFVTNFKKISLRSDFIYMPIIVLYCMCIVLYVPIIVLYCIVLYCIVLYCIVCAKYQKASVKALVEVDLFIYALYISTSITPI